ncbi:isochorismatase family protein [Desulfogranum mediterraneum]|uniref:isochorismatase family protein n=1 Tax=Desulfogranum mediterraneum TaxID=160661 RepID=UPI00040B8283|nr:isochorismatase family protein [Desulfogranum mediterraneum]
MNLKLSPTDALLLVDLQNDFLEGGSLAVTGTETILAAAVDYLKLFVNQELTVIASRDWHPPDHCSFAEQGGPWPSHCVAGSHGARFSDQLTLPAEVHIVSKASSAEEEAYSAFQGTDLADYARRQGISRFYICGLATEYCVLYTVKDAISQGFTVVVLEDGIRAVDLQPGDGERALAVMEQQGAIRATRGDLQS